MSTQPQNETAAMWVYYLKFDVVSGAVFEGTTVKKERLFWHNDNFKSDIATSLGTTNPMSMDRRPEKYSGG